MPIKEHPVLTDSMIRTKATGANNLIPIKRTEHQSYHWYGDNLEIGYIDMDRFFNSIGIKYKKLKQGSR